MRITRLAPSPTGALHLGNARTFLANWLLARQNGWKIILRIEDLDGPRIKAGADRQAIDDLRWLGIDWDEGPIYQSSRRETYAKAVQQLIENGRAYPCICSRREIDLSASAPHAEDGSNVYPGTCRGKFKTMDEARAATGKNPATRFAVEEEQIEFTDAFAGHRIFNVKRELGDFVISKADGTPAYQLAVVVDDAAMGVNEVVRGDDLMDSTPRQILLYRALGMVERIPRYTHLPLVIGEDGRRLAKRHGDTRIATYREAGVPAERVLALMARWLGMEHISNSVSAASLLGSFELDRISKLPIVFTGRYDHFLRRG